MSGLLRCAGVESQAQWMTGLVSAMSSLVSAMSMLGEGVLCRLVSAMSGLVSAMSGLVSAMSYAQLSCVGVKSQVQWDATFLVPSAVAAVLEDDREASFQAVRHACFRM
jgi:hypothetical protein